MSKSRSSKKSNKVDRILKMAQKNRDASLARMAADKLDSTIRKNRNDDRQSMKKTEDDELRAHRLFQEMKRREF